MIVYGTSVELVPGVETPLIADVGKAHATVSFQSLTLGKHLLAFANNATLAQTNSEMSDWPRSMGEGVLGVVALAPKRGRRAPEYIGYHYSAETGLLLEGTSLSPDEARHCSFRLSEVVLGRIAVRPVDPEDEVVLPAEGVVQLDMQLHRPNGGLFRQLEHHPEKLVQACEDRVAYWLEALSSPDAVFLSGTRPNLDALPFCNKHLRAIFAAQERARRQRLQRQNA